MIYISGDVHDKGLMSKDQIWLNKYNQSSEIDCALKFAEIAGNYNIPVTLFCAGKITVEDKEKLRQLANFSNVEIGGHTWNSLKPAWQHFFSQRITGSYYGTYQMQKKDIISTKNCIQDCISKEITSWRTHAYRGDKITFELLADLGFSVVSDQVGPDLYMKYLLNDSLLSLPINILPDHEHVYHGYFTEEVMNQEQMLRDNPLNYLKMEKNKQNQKRFLKELIKKATGIKTPQKPFGKMLRPFEWEQELKSQVESRLKNYGFACLLLHPADMEVLDGMATVDRILGFLSSYSCYFVYEAKEKYNCLEQIR